VVYISPKEMEKLGLVFQFRVPFQNFSSSITLYCRLLCCFNGCDL